MTNDFGTIKANDGRPGLTAKKATHLMKIYRLIAAMECPVVLEFGVGEGYSTRVFLEACRVARGDIYSVDIEDCQSILAPPWWNFLQADDRDVDTILDWWRGLEDEGIDLLHIDTIHTADHVWELLMKWYPYIKAGGYITFHDIDETPYRYGRRKDNKRSEKNVSGLATLVREFFYANEDDLFLEYHFGSTGMGIMKKLSPLGTQPNPPVRLGRRRWWKR